MAYMPAVLLADLGDERRSPGVRYFDQSPGVNQDTLLFFDAAGRQRLRITGGNEWTYDPKAIQVRAVDLTGDGKEDLALMTGRSLKAFDNTGKLLWETPAHGWMPIGSTVAGKSAAELVIGKDHTHFGVDGATGHVLWRGEGIRPDNQSTTQTWLLPSSHSDEMPRIMSRRDHMLSRVGLPTDASGNYLAASRAIVPDLVARADDPRLLRRLPWDYPHGPAGELMLACLFSLALVVLPGAFLAHMLRHRRWSLRTWLMLPLVVAAMISMTYVITKLPNITMRRSEAPVLQVALVAVLGTMLLPFPSLVVFWTYKRRWIRLAWLIGASLVLALAAGLVAYLNAARHLDPLERFEWTWRGWWNIWIPIAILTGWVGLFVATIAHVVSRAGARKRAAAQ
jgi:hypothetical protein